MPRHIELNPVSHLTVGTIGPPGQRTFYLQGSRGPETVSLIIEKEQAAMLASSFESLLEELEKEQSLGAEAQEQIYMDLRLRQPVEALFRTGNIGLGYSEEHKRIVVVAYELTTDEEEEDANAVSFWASRAQIEHLIPHIREVVQAGRPICGNCGRPMDPEGHFCPNRNGHVK